MNKKIQYVAKCKQPFDMQEYRTWTDVSQFLACGLQGVQIKMKLKLRDL